MLKPKPLIVLNALLHGVPVKLGAYTYQLFREGDEVPLTGDTVGVVDAPYFLGTPATSNGQVVFLGMNDALSFIAFLKLADELSDTEATLLAANITLTENKSTRQRC